jgi:NADH-quinone oxidoreductase subunit J
MSEYLFYIFAALTLICGAFVIINHNPINSAMCLVLSIGSMAGLFVLLNAFFLGAIQILVYAGAVMVLFLFVIMLLDLKAEERRKINLFGAVTGITSVAAIAYIFFKAMEASKDQLPKGSNPAVGSTVKLGKMLFTQYLLPFEILSILLLVAMVGVILLSKKDLK